MAKLTFPKSVVTDSMGDLYIADTFNHVIRRVSEGQVEIFAGMLEEDYNGDGYGTSTLFFQPARLQFDAGRRLWVLELVGLPRKIDMVSGQTVVVMGITGAAKLGLLRTDGDAA